MKLGEKIYYGFYGMSFILAIVGQIVFSGNSHTPPAGFAVELLILPVGALCWLADSVKHRNTKVHKVGMLANGLMMFLILISALA
jgi:hypothetical protein